MLTKQELYDLLPPYTDGRKMEHYTYMCIDETLGIYTIDYNFNVWSNSYQQRGYKPDWIVIDNEAYWFQSEPYYDGAPYDHILKVRIHPEGYQYFSVDLQIQYIPKEVP